MFVASIVKKFFYSIEEIIRNVTKKWAKKAHFGGISYVFNSSKSSFLMLGLTICYKMLI